MSTNRVIIFDTTLRDGEQSPGASMSLPEKVRIAHVLDEMGVDVIEAGFPIASPGDFAAVEVIAAAVLNAQVCGLARAQAKDIEAAGAALKKARRPRIHTFIATSPLHMKYKLSMSEQGVLAAISDSVNLARGLCDDVEWSAEDSVRSEFDFLCKAVEVAINAGARTINLPDTVGYALPWEYGERIRRIIEAVPNSDKAIFSVHCHNDLGLAVANSLSALLGGARQIECTVNGLGERAGNAAMEEICMAIRTRPDLLGFTTGIKTEKITGVSRLVSAITGFVVQPNKAIVGANAFAHESGIHQDGMLKNAATYEIMTPESVGLHRSQLVLGKLSGRAALRDKLIHLGYNLSDAELADAFTRFKVLADRKKQIFDEDLIALVDSALAGQNDAIQVVRLQVVCGSDQSAKATLRLRINGHEQETSTTGSGPVDATFNAIRMLYPHEAALQLFQVHAVTQGTDAQAEVTVRLDRHGTTAQGQGADTDTLVAAATAYVHALNKLVNKERRTGQIPA